METTATGPGRAPAAPPDAVLPPEVWHAREAAHVARADAFTAEQRARRAAGRRDPVEDFLADYYGVRPGVLARWHPGVGTTLADAAGSPVAGRRWYRTDGADVRLDAAAFLADRSDGVRHVHQLLVATASRPPLTGCFGLHEWAMVYREPAGAHRHPLPLRLGEAGTDAVVERHTIRCTHYDAFRFFTPAARDATAQHPTRATQVALEQPGCLHATMDLLKWALTLGPAVPGELLLDCADLAREIRVLDMRASPYDLSSLGLAPVPVESAAGKAEYVHLQRGFAARGAVLRARLVAVTDALLDDALLDDALLDHAPLDGARREAS